MQQAAKQKQKQQQQQQHAENAPGALLRPVFSAPVVKRKSVPRIKVISMGDAAVGKSCLIKRFCEQRFISKYICTIGIDYGVKRVTLADHDVKVNFWDLAGPAEYFDVRNEFYKDSQGAILVFDVTSRHSFDNLDAWVAEATRYGAPDDLCIIVCGNKADALSRRVVSERDARRWASSRGFPYYETSASTGDNVDRVFTKLIESVVDRQNAAGARTSSSSTRDAFLQSARQPGTVSATASTSSLLSMTSVTSSASSLPI